jgi:hypothetical protein
MIMIYFIYKSCETDDKWENDTNGFSMVCLYTSLWNTTTTIYIPIQLVPDHVHNGECHPNNPV